MNRASAALVSISGTLVEEGVTVTVTWPVDVRTTTDSVSISGISVVAEMLLGVIVTVTWPVDVRTTTELEESPSLSVTVVSSSFGTSIVMVMSWVVVIVTVVSTIVV